MESLGLWPLVCGRPLSWDRVRPKLRDWIRQMGEIELLEGSELDVSTTLLALVKHDAWNWASSKEDDREDSRGCRFDTLKATS